MLEDEQYFIPEMLLSFYWVQDPLLSILEEEKKKKGLEDPALASRSLPSSR